MGKSTEMLAFDVIDSHIEKPINLVYDKVHYLVYV